MSRLQRLERLVDQKLRGVLRSPSSEQSAEPLELGRAILDDIVSHTDSLPRGKLSFAYSHVQVRVLVTEPERHRFYERILLQDNALARDVKRQFDEAAIDYPPRLKVDVELVDDIAAEVKPRGFEIIYSTARDPATSQPTQIRLIVLFGNAEQEEYCFTKRRINLGRLSEVLDAELRSVRRNDLAFTDEASGPNATVSRTHAHIEFDPSSASFRLFDDGSAQGTAVTRDGSRITVPRGASPGVLLQPEDEIIIGDVRLRFKYAPP